MDPYQPDVWTRVGALISPLSQEERENAILRKLIKTTRQYAPASTNFSGRNLEGETFGRSVAQGFGSLGLSIKRLSLLPQMEIIKIALPIIKSFLIMGIVMMLPFFIVASGFRLESLIAATIGYIGINMLPVWWHIAKVLEEGLVKALWPDTMTWLGKLNDFFFRDPLQDPTTEIKRQVLDFVVIILYLGLPLVFFLIMGWAGIGGVIVKSGVWLHSQAARFCC